MVIKRPPLPVIGLPVWKLVLPVWIVYGAVVGCGCTPACLGIISTHVDVGAPLGKQLAKVKTCSMTNPKSVPSIFASHTIRRSNTN